MQYRPSLATAVLVCAPLLLSGALARAQPSSPPAGTSVRSGTTVSIVRMDSYATLASFFNMAAGTVRIVAVLSPASPDTPRVLEAIHAVLAANPSRRLRAYVVMCKLDPADGEIRAMNHMALIGDRRMTLLWDATALAATAFRTSIGSESEPVAGACLLYDTNARFTTSPPAPALWMSDNPRLAGTAIDAAALGAKANEMVRRVEARADEAVRSPR